MPGMEQRAPTPPPHTPSLAEYFDVERASPIKHEFRGGRIVAMAGASEAHVLIASNIVGALWMRLRGSACRSYTSDLRVLSPHRESGYCYPDASVVCGPTEYDPLSLAARLQTVTNPKLIVEILSPSTAADDRGDKFDGYREIPSFEQYVLVAQDRPHVQTFTRQSGGGWLMLPYLGLEAVVPLSAIGVDLPLAEVYAGVAFPRPPADPS